MKTSTDRLDWLQRLEVGSRVALRLDSDDKPNYIITTVERLTATSVWIKGDVKVFSRKDGAPKDNPFSRRAICPITDDITEIIAFNSKVSQLNQTSWKKLSVKTVETIHALVQGDRQK